MTSLYVHLFHYCIRRYSVQFSLVISCHFSGHKKEKSPHSQFSNSSKQFIIPMTLLRTGQVFLFIFMLIIRERREKRSMREGRKREKEKGRERRRNREREEEGEREIEKASQGHIKYLSQNFNLSLPTAVPACQRRIVMSLIPTVPSSLSSRGVSYHVAYQNILMDSFFPHCIP